MQTSSLPYDKLLNAALSEAQYFLRSLPQHPAACEYLVPPVMPLSSDGLGEIPALELFLSRYAGELSASVGPRYWGFVTGGTLPAALAGDWLTSAYDQNVSHRIGSIAATVEDETISQLRELFGLPGEFKGVFVSGATQSNLVGLACARQWVGERLSVDIAQQGMFALPAIPILGGTPHSCIFKAAAILGYGRQAVETIRCLSGRHCVDVSELEKKLKALSGQPCVVIASAGEVNTGDFDDLEAIADLCERYGAWLHVDGAFGLFATLLPEFTDKFRGINRADSITVDLHKWLNVPYDSAVIFTRHPELQRKVFIATSTYLGAGPDPLHLTPENSRRWRALPAWMVLQAYGREGIRNLVSRCVLQSQQLGSGIANLSDYEVLAPVKLNIVCFALRAGDEVRRDRLLEWLIRDGRIFVTPTQAFGRPAIRAALSNWMTNENDIRIALEALQDAAKVC